MSLRAINIPSSKAEFFTDFKTLYTISFPEFEQRTNAQQEQAFKNQNYILNAYLEADVFVGFLSYWEFDSHIYIEHFAVSQLIRGKGYGFKILNPFIEANDKIVILEIDPIVDVVSAARLRFYEKCNFVPNSFIHKHPPYQKGFEAHDLLVLSSKKTLTKQEYNTFNKSLCESVMQKTP